MPRQPTGTGLFGDTPAAVRQQLINERIGQANLIGNLGPGGHGALAGGMLGRGVNSLLGAPEDPRLGQAQAMQEIEQEITQLGLEPGTPEFTRQTVGRIRARLGEGPALQAWQMATQLEAQRAEVEAVRNPPEVAATRNRQRALEAINVSPAVAQVIAPLDKVATAVLTQALTPAQVDAVVRRAMFATGDNVEEARKMVRKSFEKSPLVQISNEGKAEQIRSEVRAREETKAAVGRELSNERAGPILQDYANLIQSRPPASDIAAFAQWAADVQATRGIAGTAFARLRNPTGIVTDKDVAQAERDLPGFGDIATGTVERKLQALELATKVELVGLKSTPTPSTSPETLEELRRSLPPGATIKRID